MRFLSAPIVVQAFLIGPRWGANYDFTATFPPPVCLYQLKGKRMILLSEFGHWYYLIYLLPGGVALLLLLLSALGGGMHHHSIGHSHGIGHSNVGHSNVGHGHAGGANHAPAHPAAAPAHASAHASAHKTQASPAAGHQSQTPLSFFGIGRVPAPLVWGSAFLGWGLFGFWGTQLWQNDLHGPGTFILPALGTALAGAFVTEKVTVEAAARFLPHDETFVTSAVELCGLTGTAAFPTDAVRGRVHIYDRFGTMHDMSARTAPNMTPLARGQQVFVVDYDAVRDEVIVEAI